MVLYPLCFFPINGQVILNARESCWAFLIFLSMPSCSVFSPGWFWHNCRGRPTVSLDGSQHTYYPERALLALITARLCWEIRTWPQHLSAVLTYPVIVIKAWCVCVFSWSSGSPSILYPPLDVITEPSETGMASGSLQWILMDLIFLCSPQWLKVIVDVSSLSAMSTGCPGSLVNATSAFSFSW